MTEEVAVRVGRQTKWISGLTEKTTCKVRRLQTIYELDAGRCLSRICLEQVFLHACCWHNMQI